MSRRKIIGASLFFALFGIIALMPPLVWLFLFEARLFGIPVDTLYLFAVWIFLVLGACWFSHMLPDEPAQTGQGTDGRQ